MTRKLWVGAEALAVALVLALLALLVWRVVNDSNQSVAQALQYHHPDAFAGHETIGSGVKAVAFPLRRKHAGTIGDLVEPGSWL